MRILFILFIAVVAILSCKKEKISYSPSPYTLAIPSHFPDMPIPEDNPMTKEGVHLGRLLFYEELLSGDNTMSCAACHSPDHSFTDPNQFSKGIDGIQGSRNSMALINMGWQKFFFWDGRVKTLEEQILQPIPNPIEMHESWGHALQELKEDASYPGLFFKAFGEEGISKEKVAKAIAQFIRTMISGSSKYDVMYKYAYSLPLSASEQAKLQTVTPQEWAGYDLFQSLNGADCFHCHNGPMMRVEKFSNNGLDASFSDLGYGAVSGNPNDNGKFKVPSLRNIALTAPYMHDGRFATLDEVINHYSTGITQSATIDPLIEFAFQGGVQLDPTQKSLLKQFLLTLTDEDFVNNPDFKDPF